MLKELYKPFTDKVKKVRIGHDNGSVPAMSDYNISETHQEYILSMTMPEIDKEHLRVSRDEDNIYIEGSVKNEPRQYSYMEYEIKQYNRSFSFGDNVDCDNIKAELSESTLTVVLPKAKEIKPKRVEISID